MREKPFVSVEHTVILDAPVAVAYERWNRVQEYPSFMEGVKEIRWLDERRFTLVSEASGTEFESVCELTLRIPERRLAWRTISGPDSSGVVGFVLPGDRTEVSLKMRYDPESGWQNQEQVRQRPCRNLERFKALVEGSRSHAARATEPDSPPASAC